MARLRITWKKSAIGYALDQKRTVRSHQAMAGSRDGARRTMDVKRDGHERRPIVMPSPAAANCAAKRKSASKAA